jgi:hypothetical protein
VEVELREIINKFSENPSMYVREDHRLKKMFCWGTSRQA